MSINIRCSKYDSTLTASSMAALFLIETLEDINLGYNTHVSDATFVNPNPTLKHLRLHGCQNVSNQTLRVIGDR